MDLLDQRRIADRTKWPSLIDIEEDSNQGWVWMMWLRAIVACRDVDWLCKSRASGLSPLLSQDVSMSLAIMDLAIET